MKRWERTRGWDRVEGGPQGRKAVGVIHPEGWVREGVMGQVAGVVVSGGGGRIQADGRQGGHTEFLGGVVGPEAPQVIFSDRAGRHHMVYRPLKV